jgi:hypothetical protein
MTNGRTLASNDPPGATIRGGAAPQAEEAHSTAAAGCDLQYGLIELETGNMIGFFATEAAALAAVVDSIDRYGMSAVETLALARFVSGDVEAVAEGAHLARRALAAADGGGQASPGPSIPSEAATPAPIR